MFCWINVGFPNQIALFGKEEFFIVERIALQTFIAALGDTLSFFSKPALTFPTTSTTREEGAKEN